MVSFLFQQLYLYQPVHGGKIHAWPPGGGYNLSMATRCIHLDMAIRGIHLEMATKDYTSFLMMNGVQMKDEVDTWLCDSWERLLSSSEGWIMRPQLLQLTRKPSYESEADRKCSESKIRTSLSLAIDPQDPDHQNSILFKIIAKDLEVICCVYFDKLCWPNQ